MNIGLLVTELEDSEVKKICIGADKAAKEKDINLIIIPGKYILSDDKSGAKPYDYQYSALFDYANSKDFDALIIDIERIGSKTTILKKEAFLKKFENIPFLTLTEQEGYPFVNPVEDGIDKYKQLGYEAVCDAVFYVKNQILPPAEGPQTFNYVEKPDSYALNMLSDMCYLLFHKKYDAGKAYSSFVSLGLEHGIRNSAILLLEKKVRNTTKYPWVMPENICVKSAIMNGQEMSFNDGKMEIGTDSIFSNIIKGKSTSYIIGDIFVGEYQLGLMIYEFYPDNLIDYFYTNMTSLITGVSRLSYLERELEKTTEELYEVQEELARDDSVLDHIGDQDYLTGGLNRRGFFAKAYDLLKDKFVDGKYAVVTYIHMESLKRINDLYGHEEGDRAVKRVAKVLEEVFEGCIYGRIRGDEFAVIMIENEEGRSESLREEMQSQNAKLLNEPGRYINHLQYSICEFSHEENLSLREMLKETDENLKRIKGNL
ncbi:MAG: GGDEF domain-containing protein [Butyrivibrio sp.]|nr:GGDEF domain-containing protein [Butyrivibrio sp.]